MKFFKYFYLLCFACLFIFLSCKTVNINNFIGTGYNDITRQHKIRVQNWIDEADLKEGVKAPYFYVTKTLYSSSDSKFSKPGLTTIHTSYSEMNICFSSGSYYYTVLRNKKKPSKRLDTYTKADIFTDEIISIFYK